MRKEDICFYSASMIADLIKSQEITAVEITETFIERIEKINPIINAYCTPTFEMAREQAKRADRVVKDNAFIGALNGVPTSIKDVVPVKGVRFTYGSKLYENNIAEVDHAVVQRLKAAGCVILGITNTPEYGHKGITENFIFGTTKNPWDLGKTTGGSSGGAAASVVSGISTLALGSDGGGSIRIPSSLCGCYGLKPNFGRVPRYPFSGAAWATISHFGPLVRHVEDAALMLDAIKGPHPADFYSLPEQKTSYIEGIKEPPKTLKIGYSLTLGFVRALDPEVEKGVLDAVQKFEGLDWEVEETKFKFKNPEIGFMVLITTGLAHDLRTKLAKWRDKIDPTLLRYVDAGLELKATDSEFAKLMRMKMFEILSKYFQDYDLLVTPTTAVPAFELGIMTPRKIGKKASSPTAWVSFTYPFNMTGVPAASIPCGWTKNGLPIGMQIVGKRWDELTVLQASKAFQDLAPWQDKKPNLFN
ncbi:MAG: amidase [Candidatus Helarchaeota archaeon]|nr:amidase [Candidatus Helarchaeota archaeon]